MWVTPSSPSRMRVRSNSMWWVKVVEQAATLAEKRGDEVELEFIEEAGGERALGGCGAVDQHVLLARGALGLGDRAVEIVHIGDQRPLAHIDPGGWRLGSRSEAVVVVAAPAVRGLERPPAGDDRAGGHQLLEHLAVDARPTAGDFRVRSE